MTDFQMQVETKELARYKPSSSFDLECDEFAYFRV